VQVDDADAAKVCTPRRTGEAQEAQRGKDMSEDREEAAPCRGRRNNDES
jgi:hypothetical protein